MRRLMSSEKCAACHLKIKYTDYCTEKKVLQGDLDPHRYNGRTETDGQCYL